MKSRRSMRGATLALVAVCTIVVIIIGLFCLYMIGLLGGSRELQNATDSGGLNVAKQALKHPSITLHPGVEQDNFSGLTDSSGNVSLSNYNRLVSQSLLVALNAQAEATSEAKNNVQTLVQTLQSGDNNISQRLRDKLASPDGSRNSFSGLAQSNSTRLLADSTVNSVDSSYSTAYLDKGEPTNIFIDRSILPVGASLPDGSTTTLANGKSYVNGYTDISIGQMPAIAGATLHPGQQPHSIAQRDFQASVTNNLSAGAVPPNSFQSAAQAASSSADPSARCVAHPSLANISWSTVGARDLEFQASIPHGYLVITNPAGYQFNGQLPNADSIYNNQLYSGIYIANNGAFSTDRDTLQSWIDYNVSHGAGSQPSLAGIFNVNGEPLTTADAVGISSLGGGANSYPIEADYTMASGDGALPQVVALVPAFEKAYDARNDQPGSQLELTAVEDLKGAVMDMFAHKLDGTVPAPPGFSGLRLFNHNQAYPVPAGSPPLITDSGNVLQLLNQVGDTTILSQIKQRIHEIKPGATDDEITNLLQSNIIGMGETYFVYMDQQTGNLTMSRTTPSWVSNLPAEYQNGTAADGNPVDSSSVFKTIGYSVDPQGEAGFKSNLYDVTSDPSTTGLANDEALFTPSSGFNNLLGTLQFRESISGVMAAYTPPTPTPTPTPTPNPSPSPPDNGCGCNCTYPWDADAIALGTNSTAWDVYNLIRGQTTDSRLSVIQDWEHPGSLTFDCTGAGAGIIMWEELTYQGNTDYDIHQYIDMYTSNSILNNVAGSGPTFLAWYDNYLCSHGSITVTGEN